MKKIKACLLLSITTLICTNCLFAQTQSIIVNKTEIRKNNLTGNLYVPVSDSKLGAIVVLGGSEGGIRSADVMADSLSKNGFVTLALAYHKFDSLPKILEEIPLEYFINALHFLQSLPQVNTKRLGIMGASKGAEAALLTAAYSGLPVCVAASAPSAYSWQSIGGECCKSSWTFKGKGLPFIRFGSSDATGSLYLYYANGLKISSVSLDSATIPVEKIKGPIRLVGGESDSLWPSAPMIAVLKERRKLTNANLDQYVTYKDAGHFVSLFFINPKTDRSVYGRLGGTADANILHSKENWGEILQFFARNLK